MESIDRELTRRVVKSLAPPPKLTVSQWADAERRLSPESSAEPGRWNTNRAPFQRAIMDSVSDESTYKVVWKASAQVGKTEFILNVIGYFVDQDPAPMLIVLPTLELAEAVSKDRIAPMIRDTPALTDKVKDPRARDSGNTLLHKKFPGGQMTLAGANSPSSLASRPVRMVLCDEVDRYPISAGSEGDPTKLAQKRANTFHNRIFIETATPTVEGASKIDASYQESDRRRYYVPCPLCEKKQVLEWPQIKFDRAESGAPTNVRYTCSHCTGEFDDSRKDWMLLNGEWIAEAPFRGIAGFHISELYSPWKKWAEVVTDFLDAKSDPQKLKVWTNTSLGETWKEKGEAPEWKRIYDRREKFPQNQIPKEVVFLTAGVDVQKDRLEVEIKGWGRDKQNWSIDHRIYSGDTTDESDTGVWRHLDALLAETWRHPNEVDLPIRVLAIDSGFNTQRVYNWARRHPVTRVMVVKGTDNSAVLLNTPTAVDVAGKGKRIRRGMRLWTLGVGIAKSELYALLRLESPIGDAPFPPGYCHYPEYGEEWFKQLTAESLSKRTVKGFSRYEWVKDRDRNEALDLHVYNRSAAAMIGLDRFSPGQWDQEVLNIGGSVSVHAQPPQPKKAEGTPPVDSTPRRNGSFWKR
jgi:phage terminase large subunit GpA-like protein